MKKLVTPVKKAGSKTPGMGFRPFEAGITFRFTEKRRMKK